MAQLRDHAAVTSRKNMFLVDPRLLKVDPGYNVRDLTTPEAKAGLVELKDSIKELGVQSPVMIRLKGEDMVIVRGHRRLAAAMLAIQEGAALVSIPAIAEETTVNDEQRTLDLIVSNSGEPLTALEKAEVVRRLIGYGNTVPMIAKKTGWTPATVENYKMLLTANADVRAMVKAGEVSTSAAIASVKAHGEGAGAKLKTAQAASPLNANGVRKKVSARTVKKDADESSLSKVEIRSLILGLRYIVKHFEGEAYNRAKQALEAAGVPLE